MSVQSSARHGCDSIHECEPEASLTVDDKAASGTEPVVPPRPIGAHVIPGVEILWNITRDALKIDPPLWASSIFGLPWIESFGNEFDIVARLGMLAPRAREWHIDLDGPRYVRPRAWGHFLNAQYLVDIERQQKVRYRPGGKGGAAPYQLLNAEQFPNHTPKLFNYINGGI